MATVKQPNRLIYFLGMLVRFGTESKTGSAGIRILDKRTRLVNVLSLFCGAIGFFSLPFDWVTAPRWMAIEDGVSFLLYWSIPLINRTGKNQIGRMLFLLFGNLIITIDVLLLGVESGTDLMFFGLAAFALTIFDLTEKWLMAFGISMPVAVYFWCHSLPAGYAPDPLSQDMAQSYSIYSAIITFLCVGTSIYFLQKINRLSETTLENSRAQAITSEKMAALGEMSGGLAHEINTPLMALQLNAVLLKRATETSIVDQSKVEHLVDKMNKMIERITKVTNSLQAFSRNAELDPIVATLVTEVIRDTLELCQERFKNHQIKMRLISDPSKLTMKCRPVQISQVLLNLLNNSYYAVSGTPTKVIEIEATEKGKWIYISVTDSGEGIPVEIRDKIFQPFFTTKGPGKGTGLGLSISKGILESHGGRIYLDTTSARTRFVIELPAG